MGNCKSRLTEVSYTKILLLMGYMCYQFVIEQRLHAEKWYLFKKKAKIVNVGLIRFLASDSGMILIIGVFIRFIG